MPPFTRYSTKEKPEVPKCQMLAANILKGMTVKNEKKMIVLDLLVNMTG